MANRMSEALEKIKACPDMKALEALYIEYGDLTAEATFTSAIQNRGNQLANPQQPNPQQS